MFSLSFAFSREKEEEKEEKEAVVVRVHRIRQSKYLGKHEPRHTLLNLLVCWP